MREATPAGQWETLPVLGTRAASGLLATMTVDSPTIAGDVFLTDLDHLLCPRLQPGPVVVMDKRSVH